MTTINNANINNNNKEVVIMTTSQARQYASQLLDEGRLDEAIHILCSIAAEEARLSRPPRRQLGQPPRRSWQSLAASLPRKLRTCLKRQQLTCLS